MGLYFDGEEILEEEMLVQFLGLPEDDLRKPFDKRGYTVRYLGDRMWLWINKRTGKTVITGDEGNGWCVVLIVADNETDAMHQFIKQAPKPKYPNLLGVLEHLLFGSETANLNGDNYE